MRKNISNVIEAWVNGRSKTEKSCSTDGASIYSYGTCILTRDEAGIVILNERKFSTTTSAQQGAIRYHLNESGTRYITVDCKMGARSSDLIETLQKQTELAEELIAEVLRENNIG